MKEAAVKLAIDLTAALAGAVLTGLAGWSLQGETHNSAAP
jgi:hypothetical protein